jgi:hypothetical protein
VLALFPWISTYRDVTTYSPTPFGDRALENGLALSVSPCFTALIFPASKNTTTGLPVVAILPARDNVSYLNANNALVGTIALSNHQVLFTLSYLGR